MSGGRPQKYTVDYFMHDAHAGEGKTLTILYNNFGHEGISAWWLLMERVSCSNNHVIDIRNTAELEFLSAKLHFTPERLLAILKKMAELGAIDQECLTHGFIWCQNFVDRLAEVYHRRNQALPNKPSVNGQLNLVFDNTNDVSVGGEIPPPNPCVKSSIYTPPVTVTVTGTVTNKEIYKEKKEKYGEACNVFLFKTEYGKLVEKFGESKTIDKINDLSHYIGSKGDKYKSHYETILNWDRKEKKEGGQNGLKSNKPGAGYNKLPDHYTSPAEFFGDHYKPPPDYQGSQGLGDSGKPKDA